MCICLCFCVSSGKQLYKSRPLPPSHTHVQYFSNAHEKKNSQTHALKARTNVHTHTRTHPLSLCLTHTLSHTRTPARIHPSTHLAIYHPPPSPTTHAQTGTQYMQTCRKKGGSGGRCTRAWWGWRGWKGWRWRKGAEWAGHSCHLSQPFV